MATGLPCELRQPFARQPAHHRCRKQFTTYVESLTTSTRPAGKAAKACRTAVSSMRWFVVAGSHPLAYTSSETAHAQPPGPGFLRQAPSV